MASNSKWRKFLNKFHFYGGLLTTGFLIAFGFSALQHQHASFTFILIFSVWMVG